MRLDWILLHPAAPYAALAIGLGLCMLLFLSLKRELRAAEERGQKKLADVEADWQAKMGILDERWEDLSQISRLLVPPTPPRSGLNVTRRSQVLQLFRRGKSPQEIAAALSLPNNEVDLLVKVQRIAEAGATKLAARAATGL